MGATGSLSSLSFILTIIYILHDINTRELQETNSLFFRCGNYNYVTSSIRPDLTRHSRELFSHENIRPHLPTKHTIAYILLLILLQLMVHRAAPMESFPF
jgi:hypothetical protein